MENIERYNNTEYNGDKESIKSKQDTFAAVFAKIGNIYLKACKKHDVEQTHRTKEDDTAVTKHQIQSMRANERSGKDKRDQAWNFQPAEKKGSKQDDKEQQRKL